MTKIWITLTLLCTGLWVQVTESHGASLDGGQQIPRGPATQSVNPVLQWNRALLVIVRTPGAQPATIHPPRSFAIMHAAIYDAVNAIDRTHKSYFVNLSGVPRSASQDAAAAAAAHEVLVGLYPQFQAMLDAQLQQSLAQIPDGAHRADGIIIGQTVADGILALRSNDGSNAPPIPYVFGNAPGDYQSTPPNFPQQPQFTHWSHVTPFALERADQFRPGPPPDLTSERYVTVFNQVKSLGIANSTAPDPSYPGAHAVISAAGASVLISFFDSDHFDLTVTSEVLAGVTRSFTRLSAAEEEATLSRIFAGQHFRSDLTAGQRLGRNVADFVVDNFLTLRHREDESDDDK